MLSLAYGTPMHQYFWHLMKKPQKVTFPKRLFSIYYKICIMDNIVLPCLKNILSGVILFILYVSMGITSYNYSEERPPRICGLILLHSLGKYLGLLFHVS